MIAAIYNVWDGEELLQGSIDCIRDHVDKVIIVYQSISNFGEHYEPQIQDLRGIDAVHFYEPDFSRPARYNECAKRNVGLAVARRMGCTHFICLDCDEYYENFAELKAQAEGYDTSSVQLYTYYQDPTHRIDPPEDYWVPFICKIGPKTKMGPGGYPVLVDPTRSVFPHGRHIKIQGRMHHYSFIRKDIGRKFRNSTSNHAYKNWQDMEKRFLNGEMVYFQGKNIQKTDNIFGIQI